MAPATTRRAAAGNAERVADVGERCEAIRVAASTGERTVMKHMSEMDLPALRRNARLISLGLFGAPAAFAVYVLSDRATGNLADSASTLPLTMTCAALAMVSNACSARIRHTSGTVAERARAAFKLHLAALALPESGAFLALVAAMRTLGNELLLAAALCGVAMIAGAVRAEFFFSDLESDALDAADDAGAATQG